MVAIHPNTQPSKSADMMADHPLLVAWVKNGHWLFLVGLSGGENLIGENQQAVGDRDDRRRLLAPRLSGDPPELFLEDNCSIGSSRKRM